MHGAAVMRLRVALGYSVSAALSAKREIAGYVGSCDGFDYSVERRFPQAVDWLPLGRQSVLLWKMSHGSASSHNVPTIGVGVQLSASIRIRGDELIKRLSETVVANSTANLSRYERVFKSATASLIEPIR